MDQTITDIREIASRHGWVEIDHQENIGMISFSKTTSRINVYYARPWRMTVGTTVNHPTVGRQQLFRRYVRMPELDNIFRYPRTHTGKGYYKK